MDVTWVADAGVDADSDPATPETFAASLGTMSLTISDLASAAGDPLTYGGAPKGNAANTNTGATGGAGTEIADIVLGGFTIAVGAAGAANAGQLIVVGSGLDEDGAVTTTAADIVGYQEFTPTSARLRYNRLGHGGPYGLTAHYRFRCQGALCRPRRGRPAWGDRHVHDCHG